MCILWKRTPFLMESGASCRAGNMNFLLLGCRSGFLGFMLLLLCEGTNAQLSHFSILEAVFQTLSSTRAERKFPRRSSSFLLKADSGRLLACSACWNLTEEGSGGGEEADGWGSFIWTLSFLRAETLDEFSLVLVWSCESVGDRT